VNGVARMLPGGIAEVTRGGGLKYERVVFLGPSGKARTEVHLKRGHVRKLEQFGFASQVPDADAKCGRAATITPARRRQPIPPRYAAARTPSTP
jgi:hypothetical protein